MGRDNFEGVGAAHYMYMVCTLINSLQAVSSMHAVFYYYPLAVMACNMCSIFAMNLAKDGISTLIQLKCNVSLLEDRLQDSI